MTEVRSDFGCSGVNAATASSLVQQGAGVGIVTSEVAGYDVWGAGGFGGQAILVVPDLDVVVVITQEVGPVFERRLPILDVLDAVLRTLRVPFAHSSRQRRRGSRATVAVVRFVHRLVAGSEGDYQPDIIVVLTDGSNGRGVEPEVTAAEDADALVDVFADLPDHIELQTQEGEITVWFALAAACLALAAASCSLVWNRMS